MNPTSTKPGWRSRPKTSTRPPSIKLPGTRHASPMERGVRFGRASTTPLSNTMMQFGAVVAFASMPPSMGKPVPMNATSRSLISRAAQIAMSSVRVYPGDGGASVAIVHLPAHYPLRAQLREAAFAKLREVRRMAVEAVHPLVGPGLPAVGGHAPLRVVLAERCVDIVVALDLVRVSAEGHADDRVNAKPWNQGAVRILADDRVGDDLLDGDEDPLPRHGAPEGVPRLAPDLRVSFRVAPLRVDPAQVRVARGQEGDLRAAAERVLHDVGLGVKERFDPQQVRAQVRANRQEGEAQRGRHEPHRHPEVAVFLDLDRPRDALLDRPAVAVGQAEGLEAEIGAFELLEAPASDEEVGVLSPAA